MGALARRSREAHTCIGTGIDSGTAINSYVFFTEVKSVEYKKHYGL